ncbi:MAG: hypothetical protein PGN21_17785 [Sphingomonas paucimobilis]
MNVPATPTDRHQRDEREDGGDLRGEGGLAVARKGAQHRLPECRLLHVDLVVQPFHHDDEHVDDEHQRDHHADDDQLVQRLPHQQQEQQHAREGDRDRQAGDERLAPCDRYEQDDEDDQHRLETADEHLAQRRPDVLRAVLHHPIVDALRPFRSAAHLADDVEHLPDHLHRIGTRRLGDRHLQRRHIRPSAPP